MPDHPVRSRDEVAQLVGPAETQPVRRDHPEVPGQRANIEFPAQLGAAAELAGVQEHDRRAVSGIEIVRADAADVEVAAPDRLVIARHWPGLS